MKKIVDTHSDLRLSPGDKLAAIDIGSNSLRLVVAQVTPGPDYRVLDEERQSTRLARSVSSTGRLDEESIQESLDALRRFKKIASGFDVNFTKTIATCAVREAENGTEFCARASADVGLDIDVISAEQEGQLAFLSVARAFDITDRNIAIADIGGGSTEIILASAGHVDQIFATQLGAVRMTELYGPQTTLFEQPDDYKRMTEEVDRELRKTIKKKPFVPQAMYGTGGTFTTLAAMMMAHKGEVGQPEWGYRITHADVSHMLDTLKKMNMKQRRSVAGLNADRADIIVAGLIIIDRMMARLEVNVLHVHDRGIRDGLIISMIDPTDDARVSEEDSKQEMEFFAKSCGVDMPHTLHVANLAVELYEQLAEPLKLSPADARLIYASAVLQDVGYLINYEKHHKHSYNLILNSQLPGLSRHELELVANVARYHRGSNPKRKHRNFTRLSPEDQERVRALASILRLAGALDRSHSQHVKAVKAETTLTQVKLILTAQGDAEVDVWAARSRAEFFEKVFNLEVVVCVGKPTSTSASAGAPAS
ncbi:Ppx/GppA family phosphatase [Blastopirellula sp. JC732]|uniref:Ppx/GppA family phosphatase n=1 Tax=Blastopirellula sediminis TaxID=2894196 RepID=A0A9X1MIX0_9BACT|nr:Ppx/GppA phosphatase family protein [Blastopirellula sediminis]MCC9607801.1 Ppx/GppA family phosphatase [Blastopirellula sediminis]MCC9627406.1 Ppx/GppA family phosphatase [Blastopirellula sediminis]